MRLLSWGLSLLMLASCTSKQLYDSAAGWRENECNKAINNEKRERCLKEARRPYEELGLEYEIKRYQRDGKTMLAPPELKAVHPLGKSPVVSVDGLTLAESGAIIEYLADRYAAGKLAPAPTSPERIPYLYWLHFAEGTAMSPLLLKLIFDRIKGPQTPLLVRPIARAIADKVLGLMVLPNLKRHLDFMEDTLTRTEWFAGHTFSAADIQMSFAVEASRMRAGLDESRPKLMAWLRRIHERPGYKRALERGGKYDFAKD